MSTRTAEPPEHVLRDYPLARLTTIRTGGPAEHFARVVIGDPMKRKQLDSGLRVLAGMARRLGIPRALLLGPQPGPGRCSQPGPPDVQPMMFAARNFVADTICRPGAAAYLGWGLDPGLR